MSETASPPGRRAFGRWLVASALLVSGCGFHPLYGEKEVKGDVATGLTLVDIANIGDRIGQELRNRLIDRFYRSGRPASPRWRLQTSLSATRTSVGIQSNSNATRYKLMVTANYSLIDLATNKQVFVTSSQSIVYYNVLTAQFASFASEQDAYQRAVDDLGEQITTRVALFVDRAS